MALNDELWSNRQVPSEFNVTQKIRRPTNLCGIFADEALREPFAILFTESAVSTFESIDFAVVGGRQTPYICQ